MKKEIIFRKVSIKEHGTPKLIGRYVIFCEGQRGVRFCTWNPGWINQETEVTHFLEEIEVESMIKYALFIRETCIKFPEKHRWKDDEEIIQEVIAISKSYQNL